MDGEPVDPKEASTAELFNHLFHKTIFVGDDFACSPKQQPHLRSNLQCDLVIKYLTSEYAWQTLCFATAKRDDNTNRPERLVDALEAQAQDYCHEFLQARAGIDMIFACTMMGASIRCWMFQREAGNLIGFWAGEQRGESRHYLDIGVDQNIDTLNHAFSHMKRESPSPVT